MTVGELARATKAAVLSGSDEKEIKFGYSCDLLSHVMSHGVAGMAWATVQTHMNVVAVAELLDFACVIIPENLAVDEAIVRKADEEGVTILSTCLTSFEIIAILAQNGVLPAKKA